MGAAVTQSRLPRDSTGRPILSAASLTVDSENGDWVNTDARGTRNANRVIGGIMNASLAGKTCTPCRGGVPPLSRNEAERLLEQAPDWALLDEASRIERAFRFRNFREALAFVQEIGEIAEAEGHHPDVSFGWDCAAVSLRTKKIKGLHENDFIMAAKIDRLKRDEDSGGKAEAANR